MAIWYLEALERSSLFLVKEGNISLLILARILKTAFFMYGFLQIYYLMQNANQRIGSLFYISISPNIILGYY